MGLCVTGLGLLGLAAVFIVLGVGSSEVITGFGLGASSMALFGRVGGGIYTKAADVGADLVGKVEAGIPEDESNSPKDFLYSPSSSSLVDLIYNLK